MYPKVTSLPSKFKMAATEISQNTKMRQNDQFSTNLEPDMVISSDGAPQTLNKMDENAPDTGIAANRTQVLEFCGQMFHH